MVPLIRSALRLVSVCASPSKGKPALATASEQLDQAAEQQKVVSYNTSLLKNFLYGHGADSLRGLMLRFVGASTPVHGKNFAELERQAKCYVKALSQWGAMVDQQDFVRLVQCYSLNLGKVTPQTASMLSMLADKSDIFGLTPEQAEILRPCIIAAGIGSEKELTQYLVLARKIQDLFPQLHAETSSLQLLHSILQLDEVYRKLFGSRMAAKRDEAFNSKLTFAFQAAAVFEKLPEGALQDLLHQVLLGKAGDSLISALLACYAKAETGQVSVVGDSLKSILHAFYYALQRAAGLELALAKVVRQANFANPYDCVCGDVPHDIAVFLSLEGDKNSILHRHFAQYSGYLESIQRLHASTFVKVSLLLAAGPCSGKEAKIGFMAICNTLAEGVQDDSVFLSSKFLWERVFDTALPTSVAPDRLAEAVGHVVVTTASSLQERIVERTELSPTKLMMVALNSGLSFQRIVRVLNESYGLVTSNFAQKVMLGAPSEASVESISEYNLLTQLNSVLRQRKGLCSVRFNDEVPLPLKVQLPTAFEEISTIATFGDDKEAIATYLGEISLAYNFYIDNPENPIIQSIRNSLRNLCTKDSLNKAQYFSVLHALTELPNKVLFASHLVGRTFDVYDALNVSVRKQGAMITVEYYLQMSKAKEPLLTVGITEEGKCLLEQVCVYFRA